MQISGYSGTTLAKKLGIKPGFTIKLINEPKYYLNLFPDFPPDTKFIKHTTTKVNFIHFFPADSIDLNNKISALKKQLQPDGLLWIS